MFHNCLEVLLQLLVFFGAGDTEREEEYWAARARDYCERQWREEGLHRSRLGKMIMARQFLREISDIQQLRIRT